LNFFLSVPRGRVTVVAGADPGAIQEQIDCSETAPEGAFVFFVQPDAPASSDRVIDQTLDNLADVALNCWPFWYGGKDFSSYRDNMLGREAGRRQLARVAETDAAVSQSWGASALALAERGRRPRVRGVAQELELAQLWRAVRPEGLILAFVFLRSPSREEGDGLVHALEWIARHSDLGVAALLPYDSLNASHLERLLYGAKIVDRVSGASSTLSDPARFPSRTLWFGPIRGRPHPLSPGEQRLATALARDKELAPLFAFNQPIDTTRGKRYRVDLVWRIARLVVEVDGYTDHSARAQFAADRHRDYELLLSGYTVLRLTNDEVVEDTEKALEKIRDIVRFKRKQENWG
jgi:very-short-patch-repair endonuclease